jgi:catechol 2,3-dioxygenase-like lactoylglutathione lyase family enzyme
MAAPPVLRMARPCSDLAQARRFYCDGLGLSVLAEFENHDGFDGLVVGRAGVPWQIELVREHDVPVGRPPVEDLIVLFEPDRAAFDALLQRLQAAGFAAVPSNNPYWDRRGVTFEGPDGYRTVIVAGIWG